MTGRVVAFGEIMLRLAPPGFERFLQTPQLAATFGGAEANVAVALASFGMPAVFVTVLPENPIADAAISELRFDTALALILAMVLLSAGVHMLSRRLRRALRIDALPTRLSADTYETSRAG